MKNITGAQLRELQEKENAVVLDVRTAMELMSGKIAGAKNFDIMNPSFADSVKALDRDQSYIVVCRSGNRSGSACGFMNQLGFEKVYNLAGGMMAYDGETV